MSKVTVRRADGEDIPWMLEQLRAFDQFAAFPVQLFPDVHTATAFLDGLVATQPVFVSENDGELTGFIAGMLAPHPYNPTVMTLTELLWWVAPEHRGTRSGAMLFSAFEDFGNDQAHMVIMTLEERSPVNPATLEKRGYKVCEHSYARTTPRVT